MPAIERVKLDLPVLLPAALDRRDRCVQELVAALDTARGIDEVHLAEAVDGVPATLCLHYDPAGISLTRINELATAAGATLTDRYGHVLWRAGGIGQVRRARRIAGALRDLDGVVEAEVTPGLVRVEFLRPLVDERRLREELDRAGVHVAAPGEEEPALATRRPAGPFRDRSELLLAITSATLWLTGFALSLVTEVGDGALNGVFVTAGVLGGWFTLRETIASLREARLEIDLLMLVAAVGAASLGKWEEGALLLVLFSVGHALEGYAMGRARQAVEALAELTPTTALVRDTTGEHEVPVDRLAVGDVVVVKPNQRIAADGFVIAGASSVNQAPLTGESIPVDKLPAPDRRAAAARPDLIPAAHRLFSGTINGSGQLELQVTRRSTETALAKLTVMVREAQTQASPTQRFTDRFERVFVPVVLGLVVLG